MRWTHAFLMLALASGCSAVERLERATEGERTENAIEVHDERVASASPPPAPEAAAAKPLPILGDPHGLLSRPPEVPSRPARATAPQRLDPGALIASPSQRDNAPSSLERDPRAIERASAELLPQRSQPSFSSTVIDKSAAEISREVNRGRGQTQVLFLYASYCQYCRSALPSFLASSQRYQQRGVRFTAASVDPNPDAFAAYAPSLSGQFPAWRVLPDTGMGRELANLGVKMKDSGGFGIPLFAVLDSRQRLVSQGPSVERMVQSLEELLAKR